MESLEMESLDLSASGEEELVFEVDSLDVDSEELFRRTAGRCG